jgi:hypothetical protein
VVAIEYSVLGAKLLRVEPSPLHAHAEPLLEQVDRHEDSVAAGALTGARGLRQTRGLGC